MIVIAMTCATRHVRWLSVLPVHRCVHACTRAHAAAVAGGYGLGTLGHVLDPDSTRKDDMLASVSFSDAPTAADGGHGPGRTEG